QGERRTVALSGRQAQVGQDAAGADPRRGRLGHRVAMLTSVLDVGGPDMAPPTPPPSPPRRARAPPPRPPPAPPPAFSAAVTPVVTRQALYRTRRSYSSRWGWPEAACTVIFTSRPVCRRSRSGRPSASR